MRHWAGASSRGAPPACSTRSSADLARHDDAHRARACASRPVRRIRSMAAPSGCVRLTLDRMSAVSFPVVWHAVDRLHGSALTSLQPNQILPYQWRGVGGVGGGGRGVQATQSQRNDEHELEGRGTGEGKFAGAATEPATVMPPLRRIIVQRQSPPYAAE